MGERVTVVLEDGVPDMLVELAGSSRKQGDYLSKLIRATYENEAAAADAAINFEGLRLQVLGIAGQQKGLDGRLLNVERRLAALMASIGDETSSR